MFKTGDFYRIKRGQTTAMVEREICSPVAKCFAGAVVPIKNCFPHTVKPFETYNSIALMYGVEEDRLKSFNYSRLIYPTQVVFIPL